MCSSAVLFGRCEGERRSWEEDPELRFPCSAPGQPRDVSRDSGRGEWGKLTAAWADERLRGAGVPDVVLLGAGDGVDESLVLSFFLLHSFLDCHRRPLLDRPPQLRLHPLPLQLRRPDSLLDDLHGWI